MVIGQTEVKNCPVCNSDATWRNHGVCWKIDCGGFCENFSITNVTINYLSSDIVRRVDAMELLKEGILRTALTNSILADYAKNRHPAEYFKEHYSGY